MSWRGPSFSSMKRKKQRKLASAPRAPAQAATKRNTKNGATGRKLNSTLSKDRNKLTQELPADLGNCAVWNRGSLPCGIRNLWNFSLS